MKQIRLILLLLYVFLYTTTSCIYAAQWIQSSESVFSEGDTTDTSIYGTGASASIQLDSTYSIEWGNNFMLDEQNEYDLNDSNRMYSLRFNAQSSKIVNRARICIWISNPTMPAYTVGIQSNNVNPPSPNKPDGVWLSSGTITPNAHGWQEISISSYALTAGTTYHLVVEYKSGTIGGSNYMRIYGTKPQNSRVPFDSSVDSISNQLYSTNSGTNWTSRPAQPLFVLDLGSSDYEGNPYYKTTEDISVFGSSWHGEKVVVSGSNKVIKKLFFYVKANVVSPSNDLYVVLEDVTGGSLMESKIIDKSKVSTYYKEYEHSFDTPHILEAGNTYRIYVKSPSSVSDNCYMVKTMSVDYYNADRTNQALIASTYDGANSVYTYSSDGSSWADESYSDFIVRFNNVVYYSSGSFTSSYYDTESTSVFNEISWEPLTQETETSLKFQIAASNSSSGLWEYYGPDGTAFTYYDQASGQEINSRHSGKRYIKYKASFETTNSGYSPELEEVIITYQSRQLSGTSLNVYNSPNPFCAGSESTVIKYFLDKDSSVSINIYSLTGDLVKRMKISSGDEGGKGMPDGYENNVTWDGKNGNGMTIADGVYLCHIVADPGDGSGVKKDIRKIAVVK